jgi:hypothetical protein
MALLVATTSCAGSAACVVHGWPDDEGNAAEVLRALRRRYGGKVYWLLADIGYNRAGE